MWNYGLLIIVLAIEAVLIFLAWVSNTRVLRVVFIVLAVAWPLFVMACIFSLVSFLGAIFHALV
jgi:hypothetical protein